MRNSIQAVFSICLLLFSWAARAEQHPVQETAWVVSGSNADRNYDTGTGSFALQVAARGGSNDRKAYLKLDIGSLLKEGQQFDGARLEMTFYQLIGGATGDQSFTVYGIVDDNDVWMRSTVTWNNAPKNITTSSLQISPDGTTALGSFVVHTDSALNLDKIEFSGPELDDFLNWGVGWKGDFYDSGVLSKGALTLIIAASPGTASSDAGVSFYGSSAGTSGTRPVLMYNAVPALIPAVKLYAGWDAVVRSSDPDANFGSGWHNAWSCTSQDPYNGVKSYIRFKLPKKAVGNISTASLCFTRSGVGPWITRPDLYLLNPDAADQDWNEQSITWNNAPANQIAGSGFAMNQATWIAQGSLAGSQYGGTTGDVWRVTGELTESLNSHSGQLVTFMIDWGGSPYSISESFAAREHPVWPGPVLELTYHDSEYEMDLKKIATKRWHSWRERQSQFPLAAWSYFNRYPGTVEEYEIYRDAGLNIVQSPYGQSSSAAAVNGLNLFLGSWEGLWNDPARLSHYIDFPAMDAQQVTGYVLYDEPPASAFDALADATERIYRMDERGALPIVNHLPNWAVGYDRFGLGDADGSYYETYINRYVDKVSPSVMAQCHYPVLSDGTDRPQFYSNIEYFRQIALENDIGLMGWVLVNAHTPYREPSQSDLNWMVYSYLAYGAQGLFYYNYRIEPDHRFAEGMVSHSNGLPLPVYEQVQVINKELNALWPVLKKLRSVNVFHTGPLIPDGTALYTDGSVESLAWFAGSGCIIGEFVNGDHPDDEDRYVMIVNKNHGMNIDSTESAETVEWLPVAGYPYISEICARTGEPVLLQPGLEHYRARIGGGKGILLKFSRAFPSKVVVSSVRDTYIQQGDPDADLQSGPELIAYRSDSNPDSNRKIYLLFHLPAGDQPPDGASFEITLSGMSGTGESGIYQLYGLKDSDAGNHWTSVSWNNAPANLSNGEEPFALDATVLLGQITTDGLFAGERVTVTAPALHEFIRDDRDGVITLMIVRTDSSSNIETWASSESIDFESPRIRLTYSSFSTWALNYGLHGEEAALEGDPNRDGFSNFYHYAFGGNPVATGSPGHPLKFRTGRENGADILELTHAQRIRSGLIYRVEQRSSLMEGAWSGLDNPEIRKSGQEKEFEFVTSFIPVDELASSLFLRVRVTEE